MPLVGLVKDGDGAWVTRRQHVQHDAANRRDAGVTGKKDDRPRVVIRQNETAKRTLDADFRAGSQPLQRFPSPSRPNADAELHGLRPFRRRGDGIRAGNAFRKTEVHPLPRLEEEGIAGKGDGELHHARHQLFDLGDGCVVSHQRDSNHFERRTARRGGTSG